MVICRHIHVIITNLPPCMHLYYYNIIPTESQKEPTESLAGTCVYKIKNNKIKPFRSKAKKQCCECSGCLTKDCGSCKFCFDVPKFGGPGKKKKRCIKRVCCGTTTDISTGILL